MANYVYLYVNGLKKDKIGAMYQHIERKKKSYPNNKKIDTSRTHLNYHIISPEKRYWEIVQDRLKDIKYPPRYNTFFWSKVYVYQLHRGSKQKVPRNRGNSLSM